MTLDEYLQQLGYQYRPAQGVEDGYDASWGKMQSGSGEGDYFDPLESSVTEQYYQDPTRFTANRETQFGRGINTFDEGNEQQKKIIDQINSGQLYVSPKIERGRAEDQAYRESTSYELRDSKTGNVVNQQVIPIDPSKGIFNVVADDPNSSGFFNNYVSTDPKGFVNPIVSPEQSQYSSRKNSSADFYRNAVLSSLAFTGLAFPGLGETIGAATGLGNVGGNVALNTGINAIKQGVSGQFNPLALATSAALSYGMGGASGEGVDPLTADDLYTGQAMTNLANSGGFTGAYTTPIDTPVTGQPYVGDDFNFAPRYDLSPEVPVEQVSPELDPSSYPTPFEPAPVYDFSPDTPIEDVSPELDPTGSLADSLNPSLKDIYKTLKATNIVSKLLTPQQRAAQALTRTPLQNAQATQQQSNMANILRGTQMAQTALPSIYKQANPFNFGQQNQPVQDTTALANLLRTA